MAGDGLDGDTIFNMPCLGYNYDDLISLPGHATSTVDQVSLATYLTRNVTIESPIVAAPLTTVTEGQMAIACALMGGVGVIHGHCDADYQARQVSMVKRYGNGFIMDPHVLAPYDTVEDMDRLCSGSDCSTVLVTESGSMGNRLLGIVTRRDIEILEDRGVQLADIMTPRAKMHIAHEPISLSEASVALRQTKRGKLPIINEGGELVAIVSRTDLQKFEQYAGASRDANRQLLVAAAISPAVYDRDRISKLVEAGADALVFDTQQGATTQQVECLKQLKHEFPSIDVVCGNVVTPRQARPLLDAGADALRVGMGCSSLQSPLEVCSVGRPQGSAVYHVSRFAREQYGVPVIADGGVVNASQMSMALTLGASTVMCGSLLAGTRESPGGGFYHGGRRLKIHNGAGPVELDPEAMHESPVAQSTTAKGTIGCAVVDRGSVKELLPFLLEAIKRDLRRLGAADIQQLHSDLDASNTRFHVRTPGARSSLGFA